MYQPQIEAMPRPELVALQLRRLRRQVGRCYRHSPFYRQKLQAAGIRPGQIRTLADIRRLPFTTLDELRATGQCHPPMGRHSLVSPERWLQIHPTTGGNPAYVAWSQGDLSVMARCTARILYAAGVRPGNLVHNTLPYGLWPGGFALHYGVQALGATVLPAGMDSLRRQIETLVNLRPRVLISLPSAALYLAEQLRERGLEPADVGLEIGICVGEPGAGSPATRARLERALGIKAYDLYGIVEVGPSMAGECAAQAGLHWPEDHYLVEVIDPESLEPVPAGQSGILVLTNLSGEAMPLLRYWTSDYAAVTYEPCACGRTLARSPGGIQGRADEMIIFSGAKFYPHQVKEVLHRHRELGQEFRILLERDPESWLDRCTLVVEHAPHLPGWKLAGLEARLQQQLGEELHFEADVRVVRYGSLERTVTNAARVQDHRQADPAARRGREG